VSSIARPSGYVDFGRKVDREHALHMPLNKNFCDPHETRFDQLNDSWLSTRQRPPLLVNFSKGCPRFNKKAPSNSNFQFYDINYDSVKPQAKSLPRFVKDNGLPHLDKPDLGFTITHEPQHPNRTLNF
jgi:hypothetical protein